MEIVFLPSNFLQKEKKILIISFLSLNKIFFVSERKETTQRGHQMCSFVSQRSRKILFDTVICFTLVQKHAIIKFNYELHYKIIITVLE